MGGMEALGPAIILKPMGAMPTNIECGLVFSDDIIDKQGNKLCAPPGGRPAKIDEPTPLCDPGDVSAFKFKTEPLRADASIAEGQTGVDRVGDVAIVPNVPVDPATLTSITVLEGTTPYTQFTAMFQQNNIIIHWTATGGLTANTAYTLTVDVTLKDAFGQALPTPSVVHFTSGP